jgi:hypothetical protein
MSRATTMVAVAQQLSLSTGVAVGALVVEITLRLKGSTSMGAADFPPAFIVISLLAASAALVFFRLKPDAGEELTGRKQMQAKEATLRTPEPASEQV